MVVCFTLVGKVEMSHVVTSNGDIEKLKISAKSILVCHHHTVKETGKQFKSYHENRHQAYAEYLSTKTQKTCKT